MAISALKNKVQVLSKGTLKEESPILAADLLLEAIKIQTKKEKRLQSEIARMMDDPHGKSFTTAMTDQCFRSSANSRVADQMAYLLKKYGVPGYLSFFKRMALHAFKWIGPLFPGFVVPAAKDMLRRQTSSLIMPGEESKLLSYMEERMKEGVRINLNHLGEAVLGEEESLNRLKTYLHDLELPEVEYISIKISTIYSQIHLLGWEDSLYVLSERYRKLLRAAHKNTFLNKQGKRGPKFVNLDMEEYKDLELTIALFKKVLGEEEFLNCSAGIVLQAYLPDSYNKQLELTQFAQERMKRGGAPIKIRIVKGANLAMEKVEASLRGWPQAPFSNKNDVDANFKKMIAFGFQKENIDAVRIGVGSHNLFDISYALLLAEKLSIKDKVSFEMLEGMAEHMRRVIQELNDETLLYCPAAKKEEFQNAVAYLVRRLDENTSPENFLRHAFKLRPGTAEWSDQARLFEYAFDKKDHIGSYARRFQNRMEEKRASGCGCGFSNEPDTDFSLGANREWAWRILREWQARTFDPLPLMIDGQESFTESMAAGSDPSFPGRTLFLYSLAESREIEESLSSSHHAFREWSKTSVEKRIKLGRRAANILRLRRGDLIGAMVSNTGKTIQEADVEVSEAIDFAEYYAFMLGLYRGLNDVELIPKGPHVVASPWNFPCSIPAGGILAALLTGNTVIFKPAKEAVLVGWVLAKALWEAGFDKKVLQFIACEDDPWGTELIQDPRVKGILLTGSSETARKLTKISSWSRLHGETGGKNAIIVSNLCDRDLAVKDIVQSAFGHAGQKCSACSLAILHEEVYNDPQFQRQLKDAVQSLKAGSPWDPAVRVNPLISKPSPHLLKGLTTLESGEEWLVKPKADPKNPQLYTPGVKWGVKEGSFTHVTEFFGPLLGVMKAKDLSEAIRLANSVPYGLTSGLHSLDEREIREWSQKIIAGNLYINRGITGAIVQRQPFGGTKESQYGPTFKAGGPNTLLMLVDKKQKTLPEHLEPYNPSFNHFTPYVKEQRNVWERSLQSYTFFWKKYFSKPHDPSCLLGQDNWLSYEPHEHMIFRIHDNDDILDILRVHAAASITKTPLEISSSGALNLPFPSVKETEEQFIKRIMDIKRPHIRLISEPSSELSRALTDIYAYVHFGQVLANGRIELLHYLREVALSHDYHRYGNLGDREQEVRSPLTPGLNDTPLEKRCCRSCS